MKIIKNLNEINEPFAITIGNFDGVHVGHCSMVKGIQDDILGASYKLCVVTFNPHPQIVINGASKFLINSYSERAALLQDLGIDYLIEIPFGRDFSNYDAEVFLENYIMAPNLKKLFIGYDFVFGKNKTGDFKTAKEYFKDKNIPVVQMNEFGDGTLNVSSTAIRNFLVDGNIPQVNKFLDRAYFVEGIVEKGEGRGRQINFPTANLHLDTDRARPSLGVYSTYVNIDKQVYVSITNVGKNPTFTDSQKVKVETFIFDFDRDIYGKMMRLYFLEKIRDEMKFNGPEELIAQIKKDINVRRKLDA